MPDVSSLYPAPPQQSQQGILSGDPLRMIGAVQALQSLRLQQQQLPALVQQPFANLQGTQILNQNAQAQFEAAARQSALSEIGSNLAGVNNPTPNDVHNAVVNFSRAHPEIALSRPDIINSVGDLINSNPRGVRAGVIAATNAATPVDSGMVTVNDPVTNQPRIMTRQQANAMALGGYLPTPPPPAPRGGPAPSMPGRGATAPSSAASMPGFATGVAQGEPDYLNASAKAATDLVTSSRAYPQQVADLTNLLQEARTLGNKTGPTFESEKKINTILNRIGIGGTMTHEQLSAGDALDKIANQITLNQSMSLGGATDAGRAMILGATPNSSMSQYGIEGMGAMMLGNLDAINTTRQEWLKWQKANNAPNNAHFNWMNNFSQQIDPRVFQFERLSRPLQQKFIAQMTPEEAQSFDQHYQDAVSRRWISGKANAQ